MENNRNKVNQGAKRHAENIDPTVAKARSEINAQTDSMIKEIELRRQRRMARQQEMEQQLRAEQEAKAKRAARQKAQEEAGLRHPAKPVPAVSSADSVFSNKRRSSDIMDAFGKQPPSAKSASSSKVRPKRKSIPAGETQRIPKVTAEPTVPAVTKSPNSASSPIHRTGSRQSSRTEYRQPDVRRTDTDRHNISSEIKQNPKKKEVNVMKELRDWIISIAIAVAIALLLRSFVFTLVKVQGESMIPTLHNNERLYINKLFYAPKKGDVVVFKPASDPKRPFVKRVIATEGDTVYIDFATGDVYVNDQIIEEPYINAPTVRTGSYINELIGEGRYSKDNPIVVEKNKIFVLGDNRNNSKDSREIGQVPEDEIVGGAVFRFWPINKFGGVSYNFETSFLLEDENSNFTFIA